MRRILHRRRPELLKSVPGGYVGYLTLTRVQRVMSTAYGGQVLLSNPAAELARGELPGDVTLRDMSEHRLKGLVNLEHLWQRVAPDLRQGFPPLQSLNAIPNNLLDDAVWDAAYAEGRMMTLDQAIAYALIEV